MARGKGSKRGRIQRNKFKTEITKRRKRDLIEFGELHPADKGDLEGNAKPVIEDKHSKRAAQKFPRRYSSTSALQRAPEGLTDENNHNLSHDSDPDTETSDDADPVTQLLSIFSESSAVKEVSDLSDVDSIISKESDTTVDSDSGCNGQNIFSQGTSKVDSIKDSRETEMSENEGTDNVSFEVNQDDEEDSRIQNDPFLLHFEKELSQCLVTALQERSVRKLEIKWPELSILKFTIPTTEDKSCNILLKSDNDVKKFYIKEVILKNLKKTLNVYHKPGHYINELSNLQLELLSIITNYNDLLYPERNFTNGEEIRLVYCLHALNHILKTRSRILNHNNKIYKNQGAQIEYRDQGLTRPKVLIIVPFRESALRIVTILISLLCNDDKANIMNKKRFQDEYSAEEQDPSKKLHRPDDYEELFAGNIDDAFRIGISITRKSLKLYADFYSADIIIASPLGLRTIIGAEGEKDRDYDFLSSIEISIFDQTDVFLMQNWEHVIHLMQHFHLQPQSSHECDFFRVRMWTLNGWAKYYRQTLIFSSMMTPTIAALYNKYCHNYAGKVIVRNPVLSPSIGQVIIQLPQVFHSFETSSAKDSIDDRFNFFTNKILPNFTDSVMGYTLIFIPSYLDFVRVRNHFKKEEINCAQICEYTKHAKVAKARDLFFHGHRHFLLYTERFHFFRRYRIKGIRHIIFYQLPTYSHYYSEMCNFLHRDMQRKSSAVTESTVSCTVLYCQYDAHLLAGVVGDCRATVMLNSEKKVHMFVTGES